MSTDDYVNCGDIDDIDGIGKLTIEAWVNWQTLDLLSTIVAKRNNHSDKIQFGLGQSGSGDTDDIKIQIGTGVLGYGYTSGDIISTGTWYHVAMVFDGAQAADTDRLKFYLNGVQQTLTYTGTLPATMCDNSAAVTIGNETTNPTITNIDGQIDELRIWSTARSQTQLQDNMNSQVAGSQSGLVVYYRFDQGIPGGNNPGVTTLQHLVNEAPTDIDLTSSSVAENAPSGTAVGAFSTTDADAGDTHTYALVAGAGDTDNGSFTIAGTSLKTAAVFDRETKGSYSIRVRTTDSGTPGLTYEEQFTIQVANVNEAPVLDPVGNRHVDEGSSLQFTVSAWDPEDRPLSYTASDLPGGAVFVDQEFRWAPTYEQAGTYPVTFTVSDGEETDSESITITVEDVNRSPLISAMTDTTMSEGDSFTRQVDAADADGDTVRYSLVSGPRGMTIGAGTGEIAFTAGYTQSGTYAVTVKAEDGVDGEDTETFSVTVLNVDRPCSTLTVSLEDGMKHEVRIPGNTSCITLYGEDGTFLSIDFMSGDVANRTLTVTRHMGIGDRFPGIPGFEDGVYYYDMSSDVDAFSGNLTFGYSDAQVAELGIDEGHLAVGFYDSTDTRGMIWHAVPAIVDDEENTLTVPIDRFCLWGVTSREESLLSGLMEDEITSSSLAGNLLGDPATRKMSIYFPPSYDTEPDRRYPVVYLLHGYLWNHTCFTGGMNAFFEEMTGEDLGIDLADVAGSGIAAGALDEMIIVMPDALNAYGGSWYERSPVIGDYRGYIAQELVSYMDGKYRTIPDRDSRGLQDTRWGDMVHSLWPSSIRTCSVRSPV